MSQPPRGAFAQVQWKVTLMFKGCSTAGTPYTMSDARDRASHMAHGLKRQVQDVMRIP